MTISPSALITANTSELDAAEDPYYADTQIRKSWYLEGSTRSDLRIDVESVWDDYSGEGVTVAVLDSQIDYTHTELREAYDTDLDFDLSSGTGDFTVRSSDISDEHGTMVSGIISSQTGNGFGTAGIASGATLVGLAMDYSSADVVSQALAGIRAAAEFDVVNNSWSFTENFSDNFSRSANSEMAEALEFTATQGRDGLGTSMVFAAGNLGETGTSNYHNFQNSPYTIAVGAVERDGDAASFTSIGANVLVSAAGVDVLSTTSGDDFASVSGTSFAAPAVSAAIALMLEANPDLGYRDIQQILALSARQDGLGDHASHGSDWVTNGANTFNGGGMHFSDSFGYGFLNVHDAVRMAETWTEQQTVENRTSLSQTVETDEYLVAGENDRIEVEIAVDESISVEHVQLSMNLSWTYTGDLDVWLVSPDGTEVRLVHDLPDLERVGSIRNFEFSSVASMGEMSEGTWTLVIQNNNPTATSGQGEPVSGLLRDVTLQVHGDAVDTEDDTYFYTDEFEFLYDGDDLETRSVLADTDGGVDAINAAAVTSDSVIDLGGATETVIAGQGVTLSGGLIENAFSGDGDDILSGNDADNLLSAGRGNDVIYFGNGADTLDGGAGEDTLMVDSVFADVTGYLTDTGSFMLGLFDDALSYVTGFEQYSFADVIYGVSDLADLFSGETPPPDEEERETPVEPEEPVLPEEPVVPEEPVIPEEPIVPEDPIEDEVPTNYDESLTGTTGNDTLRGDGGDEWIEAGLGDDYLVGNAGDDFLLAGEGDDKVRAGADNDQIWGEAGSDILIGQDGNDYLSGGTGSDNLRGDDGNDTLDGGAGSDVMQGGDGADTFVFNVLDAGEIDTISDFDASEGDVILIEGISGNDGISFDLVADGRKFALEMTSDEGVTRLLQISGQGLDELMMSQLDVDSLAFA
ncbi:S8 family serine peptidase [Sulfitobacter sp.]|uniref:S8 family serine peptidase n=1 Tax=Sulfitobacter sp. TaxID=1903071 RepID=UPI003299965C